MPLVHTSAQAVSRLVAKAFQEGSTEALFGGVAAWSGDCTAPIAMHLAGKGIVDDARPSKRHNRYMDALVRCRRCKACLKSRSHQWRHKAERELAVAQRTWFVTLTLSTEQHHVHLVKGSKRKDIGSEFLQRNAAISKEITLWLKRIRKNSQADLRCLVICEAHKSGLPHYHALIHERQGSPALRKRVVQTAWKLGFSNCRLVKACDARPAGYIAKYLAKSVLARPRASLGYGDLNTVKAALGQWQNLADPDDGNETWEPGPLSAQPPGTIEGGSQDCNGGGVQRNRGPSTKNKGGEDSLSSKGEDDERNDKF